MNKYYAGIGSRSTPEPMQELMVQLAEALRGGGWTLRTGHAEGADQAFELGAAEDAQVFLPWPSFNADIEVLGDAVRSPAAWTTAFAARHHPAWDRCSRGARALHCRNVHQVLGAVPPGMEGFTPSTFVVCWAPTDKDGRPTGGTGQACRIAEHWEIPVFNLAVEAHRLRVEQMLARVPA